MNESAKGTIAGLSTVIIWSLSAILAAHVHRLPPLQVTAITWLASCMLMAGWAMKKDRNIIKHFTRPWQDYLLLTMGMGISTVMYYASFKYAPAFEANALNALWPILLTALLFFIQKIPVTPIKSAGMFLGFAGSIILFLPHGSERIFESFGIGHLIAIIGAVTWAVYSALVRGKTYPPEFLAPVFLVSGIGTYAAHLALESPMMPTLWEAAVIFIIGLTRLSYVFWDYGMRHGDQLLITSASYLAPLFATIILVAGGFGAANIYVALAAILIIAGCLLVNAEQFKILYKRWRP